VKNISESDQAVHWHDKQTYMARAVGSSLGQITCNPEWEYLCRFLGFSERIHHYKYNRNTSFKIFQIRDGDFISFDAAQIV